ncbi:hypothetical protein BDN70DRAFT_897533 [Pholiota conissans]|uniref:Uncharacterized protein n=1 Tax=Pholiota conissans TaxID=109636 RepID=A0A9P5YX75_9AGAR|nr:hypothetical protein BDN70DRAFT_897533 [Pholiota conissans]
MYERKHGSLIFLEFSARHGRGILNAFVQRIIEANSSQHPKYTRVWSNKRRPELSGMTFIKNFLQSATINGSRLEGVSQRTFTPSRPSIRSFFETENIGGLPTEEAERNKGYQTITTPTAMLAAFSARFIATWKAKEESGMQIHTYMGHLPMQNVRMRPTSSTGSINGTVYQYLSSTIQVTSWHQIRLEGE